MAENLPLFAFYWVREVARKQWETEKNKPQTAFATFFRVEAYQGQVSVTLDIWVKLKIFWENSKQDAAFTF